jgi:hypothetical protein
MAHFKLGRQLLLLGIPAIGLITALNGCGGGGSADSQLGATPVVAKANKNPHGGTTTTTTTTSTAPGTADAGTSTTTATTTPTSTSGSSTSGTTTPTSTTSGTTAGTTSTTSTSGTTTGTTPTTTVSQLAVYTDGSARLNALLGASATVSVPDGVYLVNTALTIREGQLLASLNPGRVVIKTAPGYTGQILNSVDVSYTVRGIVFDGDYANRLAQEGASSASLVSVTGGTNVTFDGDTFRNAPSYGLFFWRSNAPKVLNSTFTEAYAPIRIDGNNLPGGTISGNTFTNTAAFHSIQQVEVVNTTGLVVSGNTMSGAGLGMPTSHGYEGTWGNSIYIFNSSGYLVENNTAGGNYWSALVAGQNSTNATIRGNRFSTGAHTTQAVWIEQAGNQNNTLDNNDITGGVSMGDTGGDYITVTNNRITSPGVGIDVNSACKHATFSGNTITSSAATRTNNGLYLWDKSTPDVNIRITNNAISGFDNGVAANNPGGTGTVYGIGLSGNTFSNVNRNTWSGAAVSAPWGQ